MRSNLPDLLLAIRKQGNSISLKKDYRVSHYPCTKNHHRACPFFSMGFSWRQTYTVTMNYLRLHLYLCCMQGRRQNFEWGGALMILTRAKRAKFFERPTPVAAPGCMAFSIFAD